MCFEEYVWEPEVDRWRFPSDETKFFATIAMPTNPVKLRLDCPARWHNRLGDSQLQLANNPLVPGVANRSLVEANLRNRNRGNSPTIKSPTIKREGNWLKTIDERWVER
jgi:hypothetical protein